ncbi:endo-1,4-beta-xylanase [Gryllotalpicola ginsengisoli]|uniref:endo-1,4-beta-xylanase n=1 Tax=Gryllotalpicola ginsengisoli TaxID=444608 RepID=UPI00138AAE1A|nr:endo-1,4-beta-xylanase [Gryllotalpicola ginsengisoli]
MSGPLLGTAVHGRALREDAQYRRIVERDFDVVTPENAMKPAHVQPEPGRFDFAGADELVDFAEQTGKRVRGHTLVWHNQTPDWMTDGGPEAARAHLVAHIEAVVGRYRGRIWHWDVVNEALADDGTLRDSPWLRALGPDYLAIALTAAHAADPSAKLFLNDYNVEEVCTKSDAYYELARRLLADGVPLHGFGVQGHRISGEPPASLRENLERFGALGLEVAVTEADVRVPVPASREDVEVQASVYRRMLDDARAVEACTAFVVWGFSDRYSWIPETFEGFGAAHVMDEHFRAKPAYSAVFGEEDVA